MSKDKRGRHKSVDKELKPSLAWLESQPIVKKVVLGLCESARHSYSPGTLRYQMDAPGGIKVKAYGGNGVIDMFVKVGADDKEALLGLMTERWDV